MNKTLVKLFLRIGLGAGFLSAVADRLGYWPANISAWGNWESFISYTRIINPWLPSSFIEPVGLIVTALEILFGVFLIIGFRTGFIAKLSGYLILIFGLSIALSTGIKGAFDYSVFAASGAAFALSKMKGKFLEIDAILKINP
ncbi:DoxX family protein [Urechidicola vernalis]|uniref:DoxX family protein n=1 Tax=Urechidicola vernalis TaxID=3075600 RepID=A0ABU2Y417_9FLAO|nr:DoxX family protein [Urechidicola sp. P050]MDT0551788.1 DoxX family protein [Urechidicola sp. P050]